MILFLGVAIFAGRAAADGDPASDTLYAQNYFVPYPPPPAPATAAVKQAIAAVYAHGDRVKVAVVAAPYDLGSVPELFNQPHQYAHFLGSELSLIYIGPLLIVMPSGFGIYDGGRSTVAERRVLAHVSIQGTTASDLTQTAATAIRQLATAHALRSKDILKPYVYAQPSTVTPGARSKLIFSVGDDSGLAAETVQVLAGSKLVVRLRSPLRPVDFRRSEWLYWRVPGRLPTHLHFCVVAVDPAGNRSAKNCAPLTVA